MAKIAELAREYIHKVYCEYENNWESGGNKNIILNWELRSPHF